MLVLSVWECLRHRVRVALTIPAPSENAAPPETLAKYVLKGYSEWDEQKIIEAMHAGVEKQVPLKKSIPVHIAYFTAWVDDNGGLHFQPDIYGYDHDSGN